MQHLDAPQDSCTLTPSARGNGNTLGFSVSTAGQALRTSPASTSKTATNRRENAPKRTLCDYLSTTVCGRRPHTPRLGGELVGVALRLLDPTPETSRATGPAADDNDTECRDLTPRTGEDWAEVNEVAKSLAAITNCSRMALHARHRRGEIAAWNQVIELPDDYTAAVDQLEATAPVMITELTESRAELDPAITALNATQTSPTSWSLPVPDDADRGVWAGRDHWLACAEDACDAARERDLRPLQASPHTARALLRARADFFDVNGRGCTASAGTIVTRAIERHGATIAVSTGLTRLRAINRVLTDAGLLTVHNYGRHLRRIERMAATTWHGHTQTRAGSVVDATLPPELRPLPSPTGSADGRPAWADGLAARLAARDARHGVRYSTPGRPVDNSQTTPPDTHAVSCENSKSSTYSVAYGLLSPSGSRRVAHASAQARANTEHTSDPKDEKHQKTAKTAPGAISLRARRIADDLTRHDPTNPLANGPYAHLCTPHSGPESHQETRQAPRMTVSVLARLIDRLTPSWAGTRDVLAGLVHAATSSSTGYVALGLHTRPTNPIAWMTTVLGRIDWTNPDDFPAWWKVTEAYGFHCQGGSRRDWTSIG